jgi:hypothetical protein
MLAWALCSVSQVFTGFAILEEIFYIAHRSSIEQAQELLSQFGMLAIDEAAARSRHYRELGNSIRFCEWRQIERFLAVLAQDVAVGTIH